MTHAATANVPTEAAARYLAQLCKHFGHKVPASHDERSGRIEFPFGVVTLEAVTPEDGAGTLRLRVESPDAEALARGEAVMASHLERFAFRESLAIRWEPGAG